MPTTSSAAPSSFSIEALTEGSAVNHSLLSHFNDAREAWEDGYAFIAQKLNAFFKGIGVELTLDAPATTAVRLEDCRRRLFDALAALHLLAPNLVKRCDPDSVLPWVVTNCPVLNLAPFDGDADRALADILSQLQLWPTDTDWRIRVVQPMESNAGERRKWFVRLQEALLVSQDALTLPLSIDIVSQTATLNGRVLLLPTTLVAHFLNQVLSRRGGWITEKEIWNECPELDGTRVDRQRRKLPPELRSLVASKRGTGYRLLVELLVSDGTTSP